MEFTVWGLEFFALCILSTLLFLITEPIDTVYDISPAVFERCFQLGLVNDSQRPNSLETILKKMCLGLAYALIIALMLYFVNHLENLIEGSFFSFLLLLPLNAYHRFGLNCLWISLDKRHKIPGTEDLSYLDFGFQFSQFFKGVALCIFIALISGSMLQIISWLMK